MDTLILENLRFYAYHGVYPAETIVGQWYRVDIEIRADFSKAATHDDLEAAIDYESVYMICKQVMGKPSKLIEHVSQQLIKSIFLNFETAQHIKLKLSKPEPPLAGFMSAACIEMCKSRAEMN